MILFVVYTEIKNIRHFILDIQYQLKYSIPICTAGSLSSDKSYMTSRDFDQIIAARLLIASLAAL